MVRLFEFDTETEINQSNIFLIYETWNFILFWFVAKCPTFKKLCGLFYERPDLRGTPSNFKKVSGSYSGSYSERSFEKLKLIFHLRIKKKLKWIYYLDRHSQ